MSKFSSLDQSYMTLALRLARKSWGLTSPNPMVGAVLVKRNKIAGQGYHRAAGRPHAEVEAITDALQHGVNPQGASLYITLEPCSTFGRTPPCTDLILQSKIKRVVVAATDPNPRHRGEGFRRLREAGITVQTGLLEEKARGLNEAFNYWIEKRLPFVTLKGAMTLDGKIATAKGESRWITNERSRAHAMILRYGADAVAVGVGTIIHDDPALTCRSTRHPGTSPVGNKTLRRIVLDPSGRIPLDARVLTDEFADRTTVVVGEKIPHRLKVLARKGQVWAAPCRNHKIDLPWLLKRMGEENILHLLVEGGGETHASFLEAGLVQRACFFYAPKVLRERDAKRAVAGTGLSRSLLMKKVEWRRFGEDLFMTGLIEKGTS